MEQWLRTGTQRQHEEKELQNTTSYSLNETEAIECMTLSDVYSSHRLLLLGHHNIWEVLRKTTRWRQTARRQNAYQPTWKSDHFSLGHDNERIQISTTLKSQNKLACNITWTLRLLCSQNIACSWSPQAPVQKKSLTEAAAKTECKAEKNTQIFEPAAVNDTELVRTVWPVNCWHWAKTSQ
jgi:hypothetical protein